MRSQLLIIFLIINLTSQAQDSSKCFEDFDLFLNKGIKPKICNDSEDVKCFYKANEMIKIQIIQINSINNKSEKGELQVRHIGDHYLYYSKRGLLPRERTSIRIFPGNDKYLYDTLLAKKDTLYRKKILGTSVSLSKCFKVEGDTFNIISYTFKLSSNWEARHKSFEDFVNSKSNNRIADSTKIGFTLTESRIDFFYYYTTTYLKDFSWLKVLKDFEKESKTYPSIFWLYSVFGLEI